MSIKTSSSPQESEQNPSPNVGIKHVLQMRELLKANDFSGQAQAIIYALKSFELKRVEPFSEEEKQAIGLMIRLIDMALVNPAFSFEIHQGLHAVKYAETLATARALCGLGPSDETLSVLQQMPGKYLESMLLSSSRNQVEVKPRYETVEEAVITTIWWDWMLAQGLPALEEASEKHMKRWAQHAQIASHFVFTNEIYSMYDTRFSFFFPLYYTDEALGNVRQKLNEAVQGLLEKELPEPLYMDVSENRADTTIVVISNHMRKRHAIYRSLAPLLSALKPSYRLIHICQEGLFELEGKNGADWELFDDVMACKSIKEAVKTIRHDIRPKAVLFADIGTDIFSVMLSLIRLAPIQFTGYGHPQSSFSDCMDYFIAGVDAEDQDACCDFYHERLVMAPGIAVVPVAPDYAPTYPTLPDDKMTISLAWGTIKIQRTHLLAMKELREKAQRPVHFLVSGLDTRSLKYLRVADFFAQNFPKDSYRLLEKIQPEEYYPCIEQCHFGIDAYPFGSFNRIIDNLHLGIPIITRRGKYGYNRIASCLLEYVGMGELVCESAQELYDKAWKLVHDDGYRQLLTEQLRANDCLELIARHNPTDSYLKAVNAMLAESSSENNNNKKPIFV